MTQRNVHSGYESESDGREFVEKDTEDVDNNVTHLGSASIYVRRTSPLGCFSDPQTSPLVLFLLHTVHYHSFTQDQCRN